MYHALQRIRYSANESLNDEVIKYLWTNGADLSKQVVSEIQHEWLYDRNCTTKPEILANYIPIPRWTLQNACRDIIRATLNINILARQVELRHVDSRLMEDGQFSAAAWFAAVVCAPTAEEACVPTTTAVPEVN